MKEKVLSFGIYSCRILNKYQTWVASADVSLKILLTYTFTVINGKEKDSNVRIDTKEMCQTYKGIKKTSLKKE